MSDVQNLIRANNIGLQDLADFIGISKRTLYRWIEKPDNKKRDIIHQAIKAMQNGYTRSGIFIVKDGETI